MSEISHYYKQQLQQLDQVITLSENFLRDAPEGHLRINRCKNSTQYYWRNDHTQKRGSYIKRSELHLSRQLAQKDYAIKIFTLAKKQRKYLQEFLLHYDWNQVADFHKSFSKERQHLIQPFVMSDNEYAMEWEQTNKLFDNALTNYPLDEYTCSSTNKNEFVRSKSEKILADKFFLAGIPYIYEKPLTLENHETIYPDFTLLNKRTRQVFFWEHFGMMENPEYSLKTIKKLNQYQQNGFYPGDNLLITYESNSMVLNSNLVDDMITKYLL